MSEKMVNIIRGNMVECVHRGSAVVVDFDGNVLAYYGDPFMRTFIRSAAKPFQAMNVVLSGGDEKFGFCEDEIAIMCGSHYGEKFHRDAVESMLCKMNLSKENLLCGVGRSLKSSYASEMDKVGHVFATLDHNCSGKHAGMLSSCLAKGYSILDYDEISHPMEQDILEVVSYMCNIDKGKIGIGMDGCGVPVHNMPLYNMALGYARLAKYEKLKDDYRLAGEKIWNAMINHPLMLSGTGGFCSELTAVGKGDICGKLGAEAVYCVAVRSLGIGIAVKIDDGNARRALYPATMKILNDLNLLDEEQNKALEKFAYYKAKSSTGKIAGYSETCFELKFL